MRIPTIDDRHAHHLDHTVQPGLDVLDSQEQFLPGIVALPTIVRLGQLGPAPHDLPVFIIQEVRRLVVFWDQVIAEQGNDDGDDALDNVKPGQA